MLSEPAANVDVVVAQLLTFNVHQLYGVDADQGLIGVMSAHDVLRKLHG